MSPDPDRSGALLDELHARLLEPDREHPRTSADDPAPRGDGVITLPSYSEATDDPPARHPHTWRRIAAVAAALVFFVPAALALTRLRDDKTVDVGPTSTADTTAFQEPKIVARVPAAEPLEVKAVGDAVWAASLVDHTLSGVDPATNQVVATIGSLPTVFRLDATDDAVWIAGADGDPTAARNVTVIRIDPATNERVATLDVPVTGLDGLDVATTDDAVWVAAGTSVTRIDPATDEITATIPLGSRPIYLDATDDAVWVTSLDKGVDQLTRIDPATNQVVATIPGLTGAGDVVATNDAVWVAHAASESLVRVDPASNQIVGRVTLPSGVGGLAIGDAVVWATLMDGNLYRVDAATNQLTRAIDLDLGTDTSLSIGADAIWATSTSTGTITASSPAPTEARRASRTLQRAARRAEKGGRDRTSPMDHGRRGSKMAAKTKCPACGARTRSRTTDAASAPPSSTPCGRAGGRRGGGDAARDRPLRCRRDRTPGPTGPRALRFDRWRARRSHRSRPGRLARRQPCGTHGRRVAP